MRTLLRMATAIPIVLVLAVPAAASEPWVPILNPERVYVHCGAADKVTVGERTNYSWNTTAPTAALGANAGCGAVDNDKLNGEGVVWTGKHTGNLDRLTVHAYVVDCCLVRAGVYPDIWADLSVQIDGNDVVSEVEVHLIPVGASNSAIRLLEVSVTKIGLLKEEDYIEHDITITLETAELQDGDQIAWMLDASEVQSGVSFSPTSLAGARVEAG